ncbi:MAG: ComEC/Rec2 family competence protein [Bacteroidia bacterium]|nr:ComEC/Rec2 family competence protein [Bacteroidia bacterium]
MNNFISKIPFLRLLLPALAAITLSDFVFEIPYPWLICIAGACVMTLSYFVSSKKNFRLRWLFGVGLFVFVFGLFAEIFQVRNQHSEFEFPHKTAVYIGTVLDIPQEKPRTFACNVKITWPVSKKIVVYLQKENELRNINPGEEIIFTAQIQPFRNFGNPDDFNYARFMRNKGFSGSAYLPSASWKTTGRENTSVYVLAQRFRKKALEFYRLFELDNDAYSFISALTLGYKHDLTNEVQEAFRAAGTSHVLAVSGLHVAIIYAIFAFLFSFLGKRGKRFVVQQVLIVAALWFYAFLAGLSPSVLRATIMLTIASAGLAWGRKGFTYNTLAATAFLLLAYNPFNLFDVGFQMSFTAVFAILFFNPLLNRLYVPRMKAQKYAWNLFTVSLAAQIGVFPIALHYFGTFPTYFFVANMLVVPMIGIIIYACLPMIAVVLLKQLNFALFDELFRLFGWIFKTLINAVLNTVYFVEAIPFSQLSDRHISALQTGILMVVFIALFRFFNNRRPRQLIAILSCLLAFVATTTYAGFTREPGKMVVFNTSGLSDIGMWVNNKRVYFPVRENGFIPHREKTILRLSENVFTGFDTEKQLPVDVLILSADRTFSIRPLMERFRPAQIVLDSSLPAYARSRLSRECADVGISVHDVVLDGAYFINL